MSNSFSALCERTGITRLDLAAKLGIKSSTLKNYILSGQPSAPVREKVEAMAKQVEALAIATAPAATFNPDKLCDLMAEQETIAKNLPPVHPVNIAYALNGKLAYRTVLMESTEYGVVLKGHQNMEAYGFKAGETVRVTVERI